MPSTMIVAACLVLATDTYQTIHSMFVCQLRMLQGAYERGHCSCNYNRSGYLTQTNAASEAQKL